MDRHSEAYNEIIDMFNTITDNFAEMERKQVGGNHYSKHKIQPWDIIDEYGLNYYEGNAIKYILRNKSNRVEDLEKAIHYLEKCIEDETRLLQ